MMMNSQERQTHWENIYHTKTLEEVSWYQPNPVTSLQLIEKTHLSKAANIVDVGGGDSYLVDHLLEQGFKHLTVLDISVKAIERAKIRLEDKANQVEWVASDITKFNTSKKFDFWHDRAAFHFLNTQDDINRYVDLTNQYIVKDGYLSIATFSKSGPEKCSGIKINQYDSGTLEAHFQPNFQLIESFNINHQTPFNTTQNFIFCLFKKLT